MIKTLTDAKKYVKDIKRGSIKNPFANKDGIDSLKFFAKSGDKKNFKIVVSFIILGIKTQKDIKSYARDPLVMVEYFCIMIDQSSRLGKAMFNMIRGFKVKKLPIGRVQKFFQKIYGNHFFKK